MSIDDAIQSYYNQKVAGAEANNISKYDLANDYLKDAKKWSLFSTIGPLPFSLLTNASLYLVFSHDKTNLDKLKHEDSDYKIKDFSLELYKNSDKYITRPLCAIGIVAVAVAEYYVSSAFTYANSYQDYIYLSSGILGFVFETMSLVKRLQYSYIINADPTVKKKTFKMKEKFYELQDTIGKILGSPTPTMIKG